MKKGKITEGKTKEYSMFKTLKGNRSLNKSHLRKLTESIIESNLLEENPIDVNEKMEVIDGQHRLAVAKNLGIEIYYRVIGGASTKQMVLLNANMRQWAMRDYLNLYIELGNLEYVKLAQFMEEYGLTLSTSVSLLTGASVKKLYPIIDDFKRGDFVVQSYEKAAAIAQHLNDLSPYVEGATWRDREFLRAVVVAHEKIDPALLLEKLKVQPRKLSSRGSTRDYLRDLEEVVNYKKKEPVRLF